jgi:hypothetical protein
MRHITYFIIMMLVMISYAHAADNSIYINQVGSSSTINVLQDGAANKLYGVGDSEGTASLFTGDSQTVDIRQIGGANILGIDMNTTVTSGVGVNLKYYITGSNSVASIDINGDGLGTASNNAIDIQMTGNYSDLIFDLLGTGNIVDASTTGGTYNDFTLTIDGDTINADVAISGGGSNATTLNLSSDSATVDITAVGASNTITATQTGVAGIAGHNLDLDITGSSNTWTSTQGGAQDNDIDVNITGNTNTWTIGQDD